MALLINLNFQLLISLSDIKNIKAKKIGKKKLHHERFIRFFINPATHCSIKVAKCLISWW